MTILVHNCKLLFLICSLTWLKKFSSFGLYSVFIGLQSFLRMGVSTSESDRKAVFMCILGFWVALGFIQILYIRPDKMFCAKHTFPVPGSYYNYPSVLLKSNVLPMKFSDKEIRFKLVSSQSSHVAILQRFPLHP